MALDSLATLTIDSLLCGYQELVLVKKYSDALYIKERKREGRRSSEYHQMEILEVFPK